MHIFLWMIALLIFHAATKLDTIKQNTILYDYITRQNDRQNIGAFCCFFFATADESIHNLLRNDTHTNTTEV